MVALRAIRLVYSDWLDDHAKADHAEFIRIGWDRKGSATPSWLPKVLFFLSSPKLFVVDQGRWSSIPT